MPFKHNAAQRHKIPPQKFKVKNWPNYEAGLRQRGSVTFWISEEAIAGWSAPLRTTPGGQLRYSDLAIETSLMCGLVFNQPLRQTEGLMRSLLQLMGLDLPVPDHTTLSRRCASLSSLKALGQHTTTAPDEPIHVLVDSTGLKIYGAGQWLEDKHGSKSPRKWRKLHLGVDADTGEIIAEVLSDQNSSDISQFTALLDQIDQPIASVTADGAYDSDETYRSARQHSPGVSVIVPPRARQLPMDIYGPLDQRDWHTHTIAQHSRMKWQAVTGYGKRSHVETTMGRYKSVNGSRLRSRKFANQQAEVKLGCRILNRMLASARPVSVRVKELSL